MVSHKTFRRKLGILTVLLRAIMDILCIYSANLHPNGEDVGFVSVQVEMFTKISTERHFLQQQGGITSHRSGCTCVGSYGQLHHFPQTCNFGHKISSACSEQQTQLSRPSLTAAMCCTAGLCVPSSTERGSTDDSR